MTRGQYNNNNNNNNNAPVQPSRFQIHDEFKQDWLKFDDKKSDHASDVIKTRGNYQTARSTMTSPELTTASTPESVSVFNKEWPITTQRSDSKPKLNYETSSADSDELPPDYKVVNKGFGFGTESRFESGSQMEEGWLKASSNAVFGHNAMPSMPTKVNSPPREEELDEVTEQTSQRKISSGHDDDYSYEEDYYYDDDLVSDKKSLQIQPSTPASTTTTTTTTTATTAATTTKSTTTSTTATTVRVTPQPTVDFSEVFEPEIGLTSLFDFGTKISPTVDEEPDEDETEASVEVDRREQERKKVTVSATGKPVSKKSFKKVRFTTFAPKTTTTEAGDVAEARQDDVSQKSTLRIPLIQKYFLKLTSRPLFSFILVIFEQFY